MVFGMFRIVLLLMKMYLVKKIFKWYWRYYTRGICTQAFRKLASAALSHARSNQNRNVIYRIHCALLQNGISCIITELKLHAINT